VIMAKVKDSEKTTSFVNILNSFVVVCLRDIVFNIFLSLTVCLIFRTRIL